MSGRYVPLNPSAFVSMMNEEMGFAEVTLPNTHEKVFERQIVTKKGVSYPYKVRVFSSLSTNTGESRECGEDAIRVVLFDMDTDKPIMTFPRVYRTKNAMTNMRERCRDAFGYVMDSNHACPKCGAVMVKRKGRFGEFMGCTKYPVCNGKG